MREERRHYLKQEFIEVNEKLENKIMKGFIYPIVTVKKVQVNFNKLDVVLGYYNKQRRVIDWFRFKSSVKASISDQYFDALKTYLERVNKIDNLKYIYIKGKKVFPVKTKTEE